MSMSVPSDTRRWAMRPIARLHSDVADKFGLPRQSGLVPELRARIVFEPEFRVREALRGIEGWSHLWLIWVFDRAAEQGWSPTVRPPRLGGNARMGVFATRSPFRPNPIGLSCVRLLGVEEDGPGLSLLVGGADLADGTPILDIKPYLPYADAVPQASSALAPAAPKRPLRVRCPEELLARIAPDSRAGLLGCLACDPRPAYQSDPERVYGLRYAGRNVRFQVAGDELTVVEIEEEPSP